MSRRPRWPFVLVARDGRFYMTLRLPFGLRRTFRVGR